MSSLNLRLPESLHQAARKIAKEDRVSINQFITTAVAEKISALKTEDYLGKRAKRGSRVKFERAMKKVTDNEPSEEDKY